jgi:DNA-binding NtrC family response regulator
MKYPLKKEDVSIDAINAWRAEHSHHSRPEIFTSTDRGGAQVIVNPGATLAEVPQKGIEHIERQYFQELLSSHKGKINESAAAADISTRQLHRMVTKYEIRKEDYKLPYSTCKNQN